MTERIQKRLNALKAEREEAFFYERTILLEEAYVKWQNEETGRRYALAFAYLLDNITLVLQSEELLVGTPKEIIPNEAQEAEYQRIVSIPGNQCDMQGYFGFESLGILQSSEWVVRYAPTWFFSYGHHKYSYEMLLESGFSGIRNLAKGRLADANIEPEKQSFYENCIIACDAMDRFTKRLACFLRDQAKNSEGARRREIEIMADNVERSPMQPTQTFYQAVQVLALMQFINHNILGARDYAFGSVDHYLLPYYRNDILNGTLTPEFAKELIQSFFIKLNECIGRSVWWHHPKRTLANHSVQYVYIGGADENGNDLVNELSWILLEAHADLKIQQPSLHVHYHKNIDAAFMRRIAEILKDGQCDPAIYNDEIIVKALMHAGIPYEDARKFSHYGCCNVNLDAMEDEIREIWNNMPKMLELALNNGHDMLTGKLLTAEVTPIESLTDMEKLHEATMMHLKIALDRSFKVIAKGDSLCRKNKSFSFESMLLPDCLQRGVDMTRYTRYKHCNVHASGIATAGDSLYAIKKLVFEDKRFTLSEFRNILKMNWEGHETLQQEIKNKFKKFGNDDDEVDEQTILLARKFIEYIEYVHKVPNEPEGYERILLPTLYSLEQAPLFGSVTAASADGRMRGETISENQSPTYSAPKQGPTAMLNSVAKLPFDHTAGGGFNFSIDGQLIAGERGTDNLVQLMRSYFASGGMHMMVMVTDEKVLEDALMNPDAHRDLLVRVTGFSAYFVVLSSDIQQEIINRAKKAKRV